MTIQWFCFCCLVTRRYTYSHTRTDVRGVVWDVYRCPVCGNRRQVPVGEGE